MATTKESAKKKKSPAASSAADRLAAWNPAELLKNEKAHFLSGLVLLMLSLYLCIILVSFFFTGAADQSIVENLKFSDLSQAEACRNWGNRFGAWLSNIIMNHWFGISSLLLAFYGLTASLSLMRVRTNVPLLKTFVCCAFLFIWLSVFFGFFFVGPDTLVFLGGEHGYFISEWLNGQIGRPGTFMVLLLFSGCVYLLGTVLNMLHHLLIASRVSLLIATCCRF